jgi:hypothetical protein
MNATRITGLIILISGVALQPVGWAFVHWLTPASFILIVTGVLLLFLEHRDGRNELALRSQLTRGTGIPGDINGYSGQMRGGRSTSWEANQSPGTEIDLE